MRKKEMLIIGNSGAALSAIRAMRRESSIDSITLISQEDCCAYSPVLTTYYLSDRIPGKDLFIADEGFYKDAEVKCLLGKEVMEVDRSEQNVILDDDRKVSYDYLLIATGASPKTLDGIDSDIASDLCYLRTIEDAKRIKELANRAKDIVIIGGGLVSMQIASALCQKVAHLIFVVGSKQVLSQNIDQDGASIVQGYIESSSESSFLFGRNVSKIDKKNGKYNILLDTGEELTTDMIVVGKGVKANTQLVKNSGIRINRGILVNEFMRTNVENIYAAGDVAEGKNRITGKVEPVQNWFNAWEQGRIAGLNMAGVHEAFPGSVTENVTHLFGLDIATVGVTKTKAKDGHLEELKVMDPEKKLYRKMIVSGNRVIGAILIGNIRDAGVIRNIIVNSVDISPFRSDILFPNMWKNYTFIRRQNGQD